ncbi:oxidoreductase, 2OG-Fe(II) oxygenase [Mucilaginibacter sp. PPCGB 2223]|uniref:prolyl hydroxylase family protein n=1 Tax=Mucilaginibacter sp. PPCGB 2223 TaxID=1886027 RepID=UPI000825C609|nr:2OG-Fe(II) oxygenase [Mucilaginibacter sp. PPCGB 2223]OCX50719.1 oxidoreductase, 2OG-Fe(II) oxygenase [Mucilaginibacter sp. PPCGB 2223]
MQLHTLTSNIFIVNDFWSPKQCEDFIVKSEAIGYEPATIQTDMGTRLVTTVRNNNRVIYKDHQLADTLWQQIEPFAPSQVGHSKSIGLNELFRFYRYEPGQKFRRHRDQSYIRNDAEASYYTLMIYLNENFEGGETTFNDLTVQPKQGSALVFLHSLEHEGSAVTQGIKYVLRTDIMFRLET